ncbi:MAG: YqcC family protein [Pseudomonadales bacterium]|nr:YqcC family protein [Pseudomonadales bacterium]
MPDQHLSIAKTLRAITAEMQRQSLWQDQPPTAEQLGSKLPFCVDTLTFVQWLQWVMFPRLFVIIESGATLPNNSNMATMAEQALKSETVATEQLLTLIVQLDKDINGQ